MGVPIGFKLGFELEFAGPNDGDDEADSATGANFGLAENTDEDEIEDADQDRVRAEFVEDEADADEDAVGVTGGRGGNEAEGEYLATGEPRTMAETAASSRTKSDILRRGSMMGDGLSGV